MHGLASCWDSLPGLLSMKRTAWSDTMAATDKGQDRHGVFFAACPSLSVLSSASKARTCPLGCLTIDVNPIVAEISRPRVLQPVWQARGFLALIIILPSLRTNNLSGHILINARLWVTASRAETRRMRTSDTAALPRMTRFPTSLLL
jgi:hypothetical protein